MSLPLSICLVFCLMVSDHAARSQHKYQGFQICVCNINGSWDIEVNIKILCTYLDCMIAFNGFWSGTLPRNLNGSSSFCKGPRTSKVWKSKDPQGPRTLRLCMSEDLCKNYYTHLNFAIVTFLTKIQNWCYKTNKKLVKTQLSKKFGW